jgi:glycosyltransferase involved in cell wall biosynthesis
MAGELVSVIIPCFNGSQYVDGAVDSVLRQRQAGVANVEMIIVDDVSTDDSVERVKRRMAAEPHAIRLLQQPRNLGPSTARNAGLRQANGNFVCFLDVDDEYAPGFFASALSIFAGRPALAALVCDIELVNCHRDVHPVQHQAMVNTLPGNLIVRTAVAELVGGFPESELFRGKAAGEDWIFRRALSTLFETDFMNEKYFRYLIRRGSHFDYFLDRTEIVDNQMIFKEQTPEEDAMADVGFSDNYTQRCMRRISAARASTMTSAVDIGSLREVDEFARLSAQFADVAGFLSPLEGYALHRLAKNGPGRGNVVEIGSLMGLSTCWLSSGSKAAGRLPVMAVDHFKGSPEHQADGSHPIEAIAKTGTTLPRFRANIERKGLSDSVVVREGASADVAAQWSHPIRLLFIDGDHSYKATRQDAEAWSRHVAPEGLMAFHDVGVWPGVTIFYNELLAAGDWLEVLHAQSLRVVQRRSVGSAIMPADGN